MTEPAVPVGNDLHASIFHLTAAGGTETSTISSPLGERCFQGRLGRSCCVRRPRRPNACLDAQGQAAKAGPETLQVIVKAAREDGGKELAVLARARRTQARNPRLVAERCRR